MAQNLPCETGSRRDVGREADGKGVWRCLPLALALAPCPPQQLMELLIVLVLCDPNGSSRVSSSALFVGRKREQDRREHPFFSRLIIV